MCDDDHDDTQTDLIRLFTAAPIGVTEAALRAANWVPIQEAENWRRSYEDCEDKATAFLQWLRGTMGFPSSYTALECIEWAQGELATAFAMWNKADRAAAAPASWDQLISHAKTLAKAQAERDAAAASQSDPGKLAASEELRATREAELAEANRETAVLRRAAAEWFDRLSTIVDEEFGMQPVMSPDDLLTTLERELHGRRKRAFADVQELDAAQNTIADLRATIAEGEEHLVRERNAATELARQKFDAEIEATRAHHAESLRAMGESLSKVVRELTDRLDDGDKARAEHDRDAFRAELERVAEILALPGAPSLIGDIAPAVRQIVVERAAFQRSFAQERELYEAVAADRNEAQADRKRLSAELERGGAHQPAAVAALCRAARKACDEWPDTSVNGFAYTETIDALSKATRKAEAMIPPLATDQEATAEAVAS